MSVKSVSGIRTQFEQESVNFYGLRSTINKSTKYDNITLTLYDEADNKTANALYALIASSTGSFGSNAEQQQRQLWLSGGTDDTTFNTASGILPSMVDLVEPNGLIKSIKTTQFYMQDLQVVKDVYTYINPKVVSIHRSDFDMDATTEVQTFTLEVSIDALNVEIGTVESPSWREERDAEWTSGTSVF